MLAGPTTEFGHGNCQTERCSGMSGLRNYKEGLLHEMKFIALRQAALKFGAKLAIIVAS